MILDSGFYISANETQFKPSSNFTAFSDFPEDVLSVPTEELAVEDASPGQRPLHDANVPVAENVPPSRRATSPSPSEVQVLSSDCFETQKMTTPLRLQNWSESQGEFVN